MWGDGNNDRSKSQICVGDQAEFRRRRLKRNYLRLKLGFGYGSYDRYFSLVSKMQLRNCEEGVECCGPTVSHALAVMVGTRLDNKHTV